MKKTKIEALSINDLIDLEKAATVICKNYENAVKMYDGSINKNINEYHLFSIYSNIRLKILKELENRLKDLE